MWMAACRSGPGASWVACSASSLPAPAASTSGVMSGTTAATAAATPPVEPMCETYQRGPTLFGARNLDHAVTRAIHNRLAPRSASQLCCHHWRGDSPDPGIKQAQTPGRGHRANRYDSAWSHLGSTFQVLG